MNKEVNKVELESSKPKKTIAGDKQAKSQILKNVDLTVEAFLGEASLTVGELNALDEDSVIELGAPLNTAIELRLNGTAIAKGELVAVGDNFGVRITSISEA